MNWCDECGFTPGAHCHDTKDSKPMPTNPTPDQIAELVRESKSEHLPCSGCRRCRGWATPLKHCLSCGRSNSCWPCRYAYDAALSHLLTRESALRTEAAVTADMLSAAVNYLLLDATEAQAILVLTDGPNPEGTDDVIAAARKRIAEEQP